MARKMARNEAIAAGMRLGGARTKRRRARPPLRRICVGGLKLHPGKQLYFADTSKRNCLRGRTLVLHRNLLCFDLGRDAQRAPPQRQSQLQPLPRPPPPQPPPQTPPQPSPQPSP
mmetsp:Transcript_38477/g.84553  ORF Transcript_38477/g.84553 Transcript_38477/m.84553 type:complete len:115 (-) Transcript_38477:719-1063(-)